MSKRKKDSNLSIEERLEQALIPNWDEPYKLPDNWCWTKLGSVCSLENGMKKKNSYILMQKLYVVLQSNKRRNRV